MKLFVVDYDIIPITTVEVVLGEEMSLGVYLMPTDPIFFFYSSFFDYSAFSKVVTFVGVAFPGEEIAVCIFLTL